VLGLGFRASPIVLSGMSAPLHEVVGGRRVIVLFSNWIRDMSSRGELFNLFSHPRRSAVTTQLTAF
jgi:hypothetical protein